MDKIWLKEIKKTKTNMFRQKEWEGIISSKMESFVKYHIIYWII